MLQQDAQADDTERIQVAGRAHARQQVKLNAVGGEGSLAAIQPLLQLRWQFRLQRTEAVFALDLGGLALDFGVEAEPAEARQQPLQA